MLDLGATTWWEDFNSYRSYTSSLSHGWGTSPTWFLTTYVLGARRLSLHTWEVKPGTISLPRVAGALPLGQSALLVNWATVECGGRVLTLVAPADTQGAVLLPLDDTTLTLRLNGATVWRNGKSLTGQVVKQSDGLRIALGGGTYRLEARGTCEDRQGLR
jgi:hypothetical protein